MSTNKRVNDQANGPAYQCKHRRLETARALPTLAELCVQTLPRLPAPQLQSALQQVPGHLLRIALGHISHLQLIVLLELPEAASCACERQAATRPEDDDAKLHAQLEEEYEARQLSHHVERAWLSIRRHADIVEKLASTEAAEPAEEDTMCVLYCSLGPLDQTRPSMCDAHAGPHYAAATSTEIQAFWTRWNRWSSVGPLQTTGTSPLLYLLQRVLRRLPLVELKASSGFAMQVAMLHWMDNARHLRLVGMRPSQEGYAQLPLVYRWAQQHRVQKITWLRSEFDADQFAASALAAAQYSPIDLCFSSCSFLCIHAPPADRTARWRIRSLTLDEVDLDRPLEGASIIDPFQRLVHAFESGCFAELSIESVILTDGYRSMLHTSLQRGLQSLALCSVMLDDAATYDWLETCFQRACQLRLLTLNDVKEMFTPTAEHKHLSDLLLHCHALTELRITSCDPCNSRPAQVLSAISALPHLFSLVFLWQHLGTIDDIPHVLGLLRLPKLRDLTINFAVQRCTRVITELFAHLPSVNVLERLNMSHSLIDDKVLDSLADTLQKQRLPPMQIDLSHNHITEAGVLKLVAALQQGRQSDALRIALDHNRVALQFISGFQLSQLTAKSWNESVYRNVFDGFDEM
ncbi:hypothetical protein SYNPS1DRAFT_29185 [Syncephalis pseudoplumigaleata]|uniref:Uncharacterized protein n=1 Tax=Syncephalis pseudoplumigaleata TaxID=1712513 RepID=A0A4P9Z059_9FUNG|nr:hypothetical protein SYNPS1DRAFT_29185 [Syncephalis pseudoplumigaleata]|eukprot:RKP25071.1 hypothetical protein SYNPS1DRAFT_29185 [Syncephalis pseudoplumigaleata]